MSGCQQLLHLGRLDRQTNQRHTGGLEVEMDEDRG